MQNTSCSTFLSEDVLNSSVTSSHMQMRLMRKSSYNETTGSQNGKLVSFPVLATVRTQPKAESRFFSEMPMGVIPVLEVENGVKLSQSLAMGRYLATKFGESIRLPFDTFSSTTDSPCLRLRIGQQRRFGERVGRSNCWSHRRPVPALFPPLGFGLLLERRSENGKHQLFFVPYDRTTTRFLRFRRKTGPSWRKAASFHCSIYWRRC